MVQGLGFRFRRRHPNSPDAVAAASAVRGSGFRVSDFGEGIPI